MVFHAWGLGFFDIFDIRDAFVFAGLVGFVDLIIFLVALILSDDQIGAGSIEILAVKRTQPDAQ